MQHLCWEWETETGRAPELTGQPFKPISEFQGKKETLAQNIKWGIIKDDTQHTTLAFMGTHEFTFTYIHTFMHIHTTNINTV